MDFKFGEKVEDGDEFPVGDLALRALHTPGHTDESMSYVLSDPSEGGEPLMVFTGDALFVGDVGRTDLYGPEEAPRPKPPNDVDELLAGTTAMERVSDQYDRYSADVGYASGEVFAREGGPVFAGECAKCGGRVMEYGSGTLMCEECGTHYESR